MNLSYKTPPEIASKKIKSPSLSFLLRKNVASQTRWILEEFRFGFLTSKLSIIPSITGAEIFNSEYDFF